MTPQRFGKFVLIEKIASGGMAEVFRAFATKANGKRQIVAIKKILPQYSQDEEFISLLVDEAKIMVHLNHPNIVPMIEFGMVQDDYYIAMEYVRGVTLKELYEIIEDHGDQFSLDMVVHIVREIGTGLAYAHRKTNEEGESLGLVHRDVSPANILLSFEGDVKIADFGISKADHQSHQTEVGIIRGKTGYMSPEQTYSGNIIDQRSDLFALGIILFELIAQRRLFKASSVPEALRMIRGDLPFDLRELRPDLPNDLYKIVMKCLEKKPEDRYQRVEHLVDELNEFLVRWSPQGRPTRVTHSDLNGFLKRYFRDRMDEAMMEDTVADHESAAEFFPSEVHEPKTAVLAEGSVIELPPQKPIATNPEYELSSPEYSLPSQDDRSTVGRSLKDFPKGSVITETKTQHTFSFYEALSTSVRVAKRVSPIFLMSTFIALVLVGVGIFISRTDHRPLELVSVYLNSYPQGAKIVQDDRPLDIETPASLELVEGRTVKIEFRMPGYHDSVREFLPYPGMPPIEVKLQKRIEKSANTIHLTVHTQPKNANLFVDGQFVGSESPFDLPGLVPNRVYQLRVEASGYKALLREWTQSVAGQKEIYLPPLEKQIVEKEIRDPELNIQLPKLGGSTKKKAEATGRLSVNTKPPSAVYLDRRKIGETPFLNEPIPSGKQTLTFQNKELHLERKRVVDVPKNGTLKCIINLVEDSGSCQ